MTPTQRTLAYLRAMPDMIAEVTERWNPHAKIRQDLFGVIDIVASSPTIPILAVQCTSDSNFSSRLRKVRDSEKAQALIRNGWAFWIVGWKKGKGEPRVFAFDKWDGG